VVDAQPQEFKTQLTTTDNMKIAKKLAIFILISTSSIMVGAQQLWNGTTWGMSESTVKRMFPNIVTTKSEISSFDSAIPVYDLNGIDLEGDKFTATFFFRDGKLIKVRLYPQEVESTERIFYKANRLEEILTSKYGTPYKSEGENLKYKTTRWKNKRTEIMLVALQATRDTNWGKQTDARNLVVVYEAEFVDAASKL
jgi:hypothetical protein